MVASSARPIWSRAEVETTDGHAELALDLDLPADTPPDKLETQLQTLQAELDDRYRQLGGSGLTVANRDSFLPGNGPYRVRPTNQADDSWRVRELEEHLNLEVMRHPTQQQCDDYRWVRTDPDVQTKYAGKYIVPFRGQIIASGGIGEADELAMRYLSERGLENERFTVIQVLDLSTLFV